MRISLTVFVGLFAGILAVDWDVVTDLDEYVQSDDGYFDWTVLTSYDYDGVTLYILNMTSQLYISETFTNRPVWWHIVGIAVPHQIDYLDFALLSIIIGFNNDIVDLPPEDDSNNLAIANIANETKVITAYIKHVPNQPIVFADDPDQRIRIEDQIIAWTWRSYIDSSTPDNRVLARMPMTKAAKRGLDTIYEFALEYVPGANIQRFGVTGVSKRGWTVWSLAATDKRVVIMMPFVFSLLNMEQTNMNHFRSLDGAWSFALGPYYAENVTQDFLNPKTQGLFDVEDPYRYRERFTIPIHLTSSSGDEFFLCDENRFWWNDIPSPNKYLTMLPNAGHVMTGHLDQISETIVSFVLTFLQGLTYPIVWWQINPTSLGGEIILHSNPPPLEIVAYKAVTLETDTRRDFRVNQGNGDEVSDHPVVWRQNLTVEDLGSGAYRVEAEEEEGEWVGFYLEGVWEGPGGRNLIFTSQVSVIPNTYPHEPCTDAASCYGTLV
jgi:PhoPQ-activated pathogenicity-related protein